MTCHRTLLQSRSLKKDEHLLRTKEGSESNNFLLVHKKTTASVRRENRVCYCGVSAGIYV
jgi:hypothetical protein